MLTYIHQKEGWPDFKWDLKALAGLLAEVRHKQGRLLGKMEGLGFSLQVEATLETITLDVVKSSEIEGEVLDVDQVRSSVARRLGMDVAGTPADRHVEGVVEMMLDATRNYQQPLTHERLYDWHAAMFPTGRSGMQRISVGQYRDNTKDDPMQVVSGAVGKEKVHFEAPQAERLMPEMTQFLGWFNQTSNTDDIIKAAIAHLWFVTIHPFDDGNGRIARTITDMQLSRADKTSQRFYSMSAQIRTERKEYYDILEQTQKGDLDITKWLTWFLECLNRAFGNTDKLLSNVLGKAKFWEKFSSVTISDRQRRMLNKMFDGFDGKLTSSKWAKITKTSQDTAGRDINDLVSKGMLLKENSGGRSTNYVLPMV